MKTRLSELLPWYTNRTLTPGEQHRVEVELAQSAEARNELEDLDRLFEQMKTVRQEQQPAPAVWVGIRRQIRSQQVGQLPGRNLFLEWGSGFVLACLILVFLWSTLRPGVALAWRIDGENPETFRVYRAIQGSEAYQLVGEIEARSGIHEYQFVDAMPLPVQKYVYRVEGIGKVGRLALSQSVTSNPLAILPAQVAILFASILAAYILVNIVQLMPYRLQKNTSGLFA